MSQPSRTETVALDSGRVSKNSCHSRRPYLKRCVSGDVFEVDVGGQNGQLVTDAQLSQQHVDCPRLNSMPAAQIAQLCGGDVILPVGVEERERRKALDDLPPGFGSRETVQQLLEDETGAEDDHLSQAHE
jgi:hypothetical protein